MDVFRMFFPPDEQRFLSTNEPDAKCRQTCIDGGKDAKEPAFLSLRDAILPLRLKLCFR